MALAGGVAPGAAHTAHAVQTGQLDVAVMSSAGGEVGVERGAGIGAEAGAEAGVEAVAETVIETSAGAAGFSGTLAQAANKAGAAVKNRRK